MTIGKSVSFVKKVGNFAVAVGEIAGNPALVDGAVLETRKAICGACEFFNPKGNLGFGECKKCGCTRAKLFFKVSKCPIGRWV